MKNLKLIKVESQMLSDAALADCIEKLGDHADEPTSEQITEVLPGLVERHGLAITRLMLASIPSVETTYISSSIIREIAQFGGALDGLVHPLVAVALKSKFSVQPTRP